MIPFDLETLLDECVQFTQRLIQTPSPTHHEMTLAHLIAEQMRQVGFDEVWLDELHNVYGRVYGQDRSLPALVLNSHTDHVDPGDLSLWQTAPFGGEIRDGRIYGRGACDIKGPLAVQIYSIIGLLRQGERPRRDVVFCGVVEEEIGGTGAKYWVKHLDYPVDLVILGEPSSNRLSLGHRGIEGYWVQFNGRSAHASAPSRGENPNYALAIFLQRLAERQKELKSHPYLGETTVSPTVMQVDTTSTNVIPAWARVFLDFRTAAESPASLIAFIEALAHDLPHVILPGHTWSDMTSAEPLVGFATPPESEPVQRVLAALARGTGRTVPTFSYQFATDGRFFPAYGLQVLGYAPGAEEVAHTADEYIPIAQMAEALQGYMQILREY